LIEDLEGFAALKVCHVGALSSLLARDFKVVRYLSNVRQNMLLPKSLSIDPPLLQYALPSDWS
jgi:hypothetical protein